VADPYADRSDLPGEERLAPDSALAAAARAAGARVLTRPAEAAAEPGTDAGAAVVVVADDGLVPPLARISPEFAAALLCDADRGSGAAEDAAVAAARALLATGEPVYLLKSGIVAGPAGREGAYESAAESVIAALDAAREGRVGWERDPDFGYGVAAALPGVAEPGSAAGDAFVPRLLYAAADRVYEHAELVEVTKRRRHERLRAAGIADEGLLAAVGWPIEPTGREWKD